MSKQHNKFSGLNADSVGIPSVFERGSSNNLNVLQGVYIAKVVDHADENYQGGVYVELIGQEYLTDKSTHEIRRTYHKVRPTSPFGGVIQGQNFSNNYGAHFQPPSPGSEVVVAFTGREQEGFLLGVLGDANRNASVPGIPASDLSESPNDPTFTIASTMDSSAIETQQGNQRPRHPIANAISLQGLGYDGLRGLTSSGGRRESPSNVTGFLTPGGHSITMDDGTLAYKEGVVYVPDKSREAGKNNLIRIRSGQGGQFLINDSAGIVYVINQKGTSWVQMDASGNVDIYAQGDISMRSEGDFNVHADGDFNVESEAINMKARGSEGIKVEAATGDIDIRSNVDTKITADRNMHLRAYGYIRATAPLIDLNGPIAETATKPTINSLAVNRGVKESVSPRVPEHEPWGGHAANESKVAAQARSVITPDTTDYDLSQNTGGGGATPTVTPNDSTGSRPPNSTDAPRQSTRYDPSNPPSTPTAADSENNPRTGGSWE